MHVVFVICELWIIHLIFYLPCSERLEKISDIRRNIQQSIVVLLSAMDKLDIPFENEGNKESRDFIMSEAGDPESHRRNVRSVHDYFEFIYRITFSNIQSSWTLVVAQS